MTIWDEKPKSRSFPNFWDGRPLHFVDALNPWLEKVRPYVELAEQIIATFNKELPPEDIITFYKARQAMIKRYGKIEDLIEDSKKLKELQASTETPT